MKAREEFTWTYTPTDYLEQEITIDIDGFVMTIAEGAARVEVDSDYFKANPNIRRQFHDALRDRLLGVQLVAHERFELSKSRRVPISPSGGRGCVIEPETGHLRSVGGKPDIVQYDANGRVILDTKRDRIETKRSLAERVAKFRSQSDTLARMIRGFDGAMRNPKDEFVYLWEIADAAKLRFKDTPDIRASLGFDAGPWKRLKELCNELPLWQGRHRGKLPGPLRDATNDELDEARRIALGIIEAYMGHLEAERTQGEQ